MYVLEAAWPLARAPAYGGDGGAGGANSCPAGGGAGSSFGAAGGGGKFNTSLSPLLAAAPGGGAGVACGAVATLMRGNALARTCVRGKPDAHDGDAPPPFPRPNLRVFIDVEDGAVQGPGRLPSGLRRLAGLQDVDHGLDGALLGRQTTKMPRSQVAPKGRHVAPLAMCVTTNVRTLKHTYVRTYAQYRTHIPTVVRSHMSSPSGAAPPNIRKCVLRASQAAKDWSAMVAAGIGCVTQTAGRGHVVASASRKAATMQDLRQIGSVRE